MMLLKKEEECCICNKRLFQYEAVHYTFSGRIVSTSCNNGCRNEAIRKIILEHSGFDVGDDFNLYHLADHPRRNS